jgi:methionine sulfoxide reductase heme-binding subunit
MVGANKPLALQSIIEMSKRTLIILKVFLHLACLTPFYWLLHSYASGTLEQKSDPVAWITHLTGDWALWMLLATLAITPLRRLSTNLGWLIRLRRMIGLYSFFYASLHLATYVFLFSGYDLAAVFAGIRRGHLSVVTDQWRQIWPSIWDDVHKRRFIQVGFAAWILLLVLAASSPARIMRWMGGRRWQRLHRLVYVAAFAAIVHRWWMVKAGEHDPWTITVVLAVLLFARIAYTASKHTRRQRKPDLFRSGGSR